MLVQDDLLDELELVTLVFGKMGQRLLRREYYLRPEAEVKRKATSRRLGYCLSPFGLRLAPFALGRNTSARMG